MQGNRVRGGIGSSSEGVPAPIRRTVGVDGQDVLALGSHAGSRCVAVTSDDLIERVRANSHNRAILARLPELGVKGAMLTAGCLFQTVWNLAGGREPDADIADYDLFYFDDADLSYESEDAVIRRGAALFDDLGVKVEIRNQARVHLWYPARFGGEYPALGSTEDGIDRFLVACTCVGIANEGGRLRLHATYGLEELEAGVLRPNPRMLAPDLFRAKAESYQRRWPALVISE